MSGATLLRGGVLCPIESASRTGDLLIVGNAIQALGTVPPAAIPEGTRVVDVSGCAVLPGLVQAHIHLCQTLCRGRADDLLLLDWLRERVLPYEAALAEDDVRLAAELGCAELLLGGTTAFLDMGTARHEDALCEVVARSGLRATLGKAMMDLPGSVPAGLLETTRDSLAASDALCKRWHGAAEGRLRYAYAPRFALSCTEELLREVGARIAGDDRDGPRLHTHAAEQVDEVALVRERYGRGNLEALSALGLGGPRSVFAHCVHLDPDEPDLLAAEGSHVAHCPSSNLKLGSGVARIVELLAHGVNVAIGADGAPCNNRLDGFTELRLCALLQKAHAGPASLPASVALRLATLGGARALGIDGLAGTLTVGKRADLTVVDLGGVHCLPAHDATSTLVYAAQATDVRSVYVDGRALVEDGELTAATGLDVERLRAHSRERVPALLRRAGIAG